MIPVLLQAEDSKGMSIDVATFGMFLVRDCSLEELNLLCSIVLRSEIHQNHDLLEKVLVARIKDPQFEIDVVGIVQKALEHVADEKRKAELQRETLHADTMRDLRQAERLVQELREVARRTEKKRPVGHSGAEDISAGHRPGPKESKQFDETFYL